MRPRQIGRFGSPNWSVGFSVGQLVGLFPNWSVGFPVGQLVGFPIGQLVFQTWVSKSEVLFYSVFKQNF